MLFAKKTTLDETATDPATPTTSRPAPGELLTLRQLAAAIGIDAGPLCRESKRRGFPSQTRDGKRVYCLEDVEAWRNRNIKRRKASPTATTAATSATAPTGPTGQQNSQADAQAPRTAASQQAGTLAPIAGDDPGVVMMLGGKGSAIDISRAAMQLAAKTVARSAAAGTLTTNELDGLKKTLQELRQAEADYLDLETQARRLIPRPEVESIVGEVVSRVVRVVGILENSIGTEFAIWLADPKVQAMASDERTRAVRDFVAKTCREVRQAEADGVQKLIDASRAEDERPDPR